MRMVSKFFLYTGVFLIFLYTVFYFLMQIYTYNLYWIVIIICLYKIISYYNNDIKYIKRIIVYFVIILSAFGVYGFGVYCLGGELVYNLSKYLCISLDFVIESPFNIVTYMIKFTVFIGILFIEIGFSLKNINFRR